MENIKTKHQNRNKLKWIIMKTQNLTVSLMIFIGLLVHASCGGGNHAQKEKMDEMIYEKITVEAVESEEAVDMAPSEDKMKPDFNTEGYDVINENPFVSTFNQPLSTFSVDVDRASYANIRRMLNNNHKPNKDAVRIEEMINYFNYEYPQAKDNEPFSVNLEMGKCPWNTKHNLLLIGLQGKNIDINNTPASNLVFLLDVSGSMSDANKLPLLKQSLKILLEKLRPKDQVAIVVYAGAAGVVLPSTSCDNKDEILSSLNKLNAGGSTAGGEGIRLAYKIAQNNYIKGGNNRIVLATDGDFNIGESSNAAMVRLIEEKRKEGVFLTVLGFGMGNYKDDKMEQLSNAGNGNYAYIDNILEAKKVLGKEFFGTIYTIAKDVKIQIEFNPAQVKGYRLIGYENRMLAAEDFNDDQKDAGEIGSGHTVTALYEIIPANSDEKISGVDDLEYQKKNLVQSDNLMTLKLRYKEPEGETSKLIKQKILSNNIFKENNSNNFKWAASVAEFGLLLRDSKFKANANYKQLIENANEAKGDDAEGYRAEFIRLVKIAEML